MIEPSLRTLLMPPIGTPPLAESRLVTAHEAAIALPAVTVRTEEKQCAAFRDEAKALPENRFAMSAHAYLRAALDNGERFVTA